MLGKSSSRSAGSLSRGDGFEELELAVLNLENGGGLDRIALGVERELSGHAFEILGGGDRIAQLRSLGAAGAFDRFGEDVGGVVAEGGHGIGSFVILLFVGGDK